MPTERACEIAVIGAGVMGLFTALELRRRGRDVAVVDAWAPGHARATSSGETRIVRCGYGRDGFYARWARRALDAWDRWGERWGRPVLHRTGVLWLARRPDGFEAATEETLRAEGIPVERLDPGELAHRYPQIGRDGIAFALLEPDAGAVLARESMRRLARSYLDAGGRLERGRAHPGVHRAERLRDVRWQGVALAAERFVFACGPWLGELFPDVLGEGRLRVTRQEELGFGVPPGERAFDADRCPTWVEIGEYYGVPCLDGRAFKVGVDRLGPAFDPTRDDRRIDGRVVRRARRFLARRFPALEEAPLVEGRVCTYASTPDQHFLVDRHPRWSNVWLVGGGSGHGFKFGPVLGELVARLVDEDAEGPDDERFRLGPRRPRGWREA